MKISGKAWNKTLLARMPPLLAGELERGWSFNPKQQFSKSKFNAKKKKPKK